MGCTDSKSVGGEGARRGLTKIKSEPQLQRPVEHYSPSRDIDRIYGAGFHSPVGSARVSPRIGSVSGGKGKSSSGHPTEVFEVALQLQGLLQIPRDVLSQITAAFPGLLRGSGASAAELWAVIEHETGRRYEGAATEELLPFLLSRLGGERGRMCAETALEGIFDRKGELVVDEGCVIEGTSAAEHFVISGGGGAVVTGGDGSDVFMFMPSPLATPDMPHTLTDFDPSEDVLDLRALPISGLPELSIDPHHHWHCRVRGPHLDVVLIGVTVQELRPKHFILPDPGSVPKAPPAGSPAAPSTTVLQQPTDRAPILVEAGQTCPASPRPETYLMQGAGTTLVSGPNPDVFVFLPKAGGTPTQPHTIRQFSAEKGDKLDLRGLGVSRMESVRVADSDGSAMVSCEGGGLYLVLPGVESTSLRPENFVLAAAEPEVAVIDIRPKAQELLLAWLACRAALTSSAATPSDANAGRSTATVTSDRTDSPPPSAHPRDDQPPLREPPEWYSRMMATEGAAGCLATMSRHLRTGVDRAFYVHYEAAQVQIDPRSVFRGRPFRIPAPSLRQGNLLPPKAQGKGYTVVLDLDETLVYSRHIHTTHQLCVRYGVHDLFALLRQFRCEVVMWSAADAETVNAIWAAVDPSEVTTTVLPREVWQDGPHNVGKDLRRLGRDLDSVLMIDNTPLAVEGWLSNAVVVRDYLGGPHCADAADELPQLVSLLRQLFVSKQPVPQFLAASDRIAVAKLTRKSTTVEFNALHHRVMRE